MENKDILKKIKKSKNHIEKLEQKLEIQKIKADITWEKKILKEWGIK